MSKELTEKSDTEASLESNGFAFKFSFVGITIIAFLCSYVFQSEYNNISSSSSSEIEEELSPKQPHSPIQIKFAKQILLPDDDDVEFCSNIHYTGLLTHITTIMEESSVESRVSKSQVFVMLNGENEGLMFNFPNTSCLSTLATSAARDLGADTDWTQLGMSLMDQNGVPVKTPEDLESSGRIVHVLLSQQLWQWPGIKIGHIHTVSPTINLTTISLRPKVFDVQGFLSQTEADEIIALGSATLNRSRTVDASMIVSKARTSHTAFLPESFFTMDFRARSTKLARLPNPLFAERLQLVRYDSGEYYRTHMDTLRSPTPFTAHELNSVVLQDYFSWIEFIKSTISKIPDDELPEGYKTGQEFVPEEESAIRFQHALLSLLLQDVNSSKYFTTRNFNSLVKTLTHIAEHAPNREIMNDILNPENKVDHILVEMKRLWEAKVVGIHPSLHYTFPKRPNGIAQYYRWIRFAKDATMLNSEFPEDYRPSYVAKFQNTLADLVLSQYSQSELAAVSSEKAAAWLVENHGEYNVLLIVLRQYPALLELVVKSWESHTKLYLGYEIPSGNVPHIYPQRFATIFLYLNEVPAPGGETVFPFALNGRTNPTKNAVDRGSMTECNVGLAVPARKLHASFFYSQTPEHQVNPYALHGGCPPLAGHIKWGSNSFIWNVESNEGPHAWKGQEAN